MKKANPAPTALEVHPLTPGRWPDFESLFGSRGACGGCWCMWWRRTRADFLAGKGEGNRVAMRALVESGDVPGLLAYSNGRPIGWVSLGQRGGFSRLDRSRTLAPVDDRPVWSVVCFFVAKDARGRGVAGALLRAAADFALGQGARILEGYPTDDPPKPLPAPFVYTGVTSLFVKAGFREAARRSPSRPVMRLDLAQRTR
ncbi:MAG: GNAT family N-acetyltransferase [Acidobacteriota bacterium]